MSETPSTGLPVPAPPTEGAAPPAGRPPPEKPGFVLPTRAMAIGAGSLLVLAIVSVGVVLARKQLRKEEAPVEAQAPAPVTLDLPETAAHAKEGTSPDKIFNATNDAMKEGLDAVRAIPSVDGSIDELPPAPEGSANAGLQEAAKDAAKLLAPKTPGEIDLSTGGAAESLEDAAEADAKNEFFAPEAAATIHGVGVANGLAGVVNALPEFGAATIGGSDDINRMNEGFARLQSAQSRNPARAALAFNALSDRIAEGTPFQDELAAFEALGGGALGPELAAEAPRGVPTIAMLAAEFPPLRDKALAAARVERAKGPLDRIGAEIASFVHLRAAGPMDGAAPVAILSRAEAKLGAGDLAGAHGELDGLVGGAREIFADWRARAATRLQADVALARAGARLAASLDGSAR